MKGVGIANCLIERLGCPWYMAGEELRNASPLRLGLARGWLHESLSKGKLGYEEW